MNWISVAVGLVAMALAVYTASDPMSRSRSWTTPEEYEENPQRARQRHYERAYVFAGFLFLLGAFFVAVGLVVD